MEPNTPSASGPSKGRVLAAIARYVLGLPLVVFGLNLFFNFIPQPKTPISEGAMAFAGALMKSGYMMPLIGATLLVTGVLLVTHRFVALARFAPFLLNRILFHACLEHTGLPMAAG